jgi:multidrug efflux pump subunit AcrB
VDTQDIATALRIMVGGDDRVTRFRDETMNEDYDVQVRLKDGDRNDAETIARLFVPRKDGGLARLDNVVTLVPTQTASRIDRLDRQRQVSLRAALRRDTPRPTASPPCAPKWTKWDCPPVTRRGFPVGRANWNERSTSSSGRSCSR